MTTHYNSDLKNIPLKYQNVIIKCIEKAKTSHMQSKHCACLEKNGRIIMISLNEYSNISESKINKFSYHAEENLIKKYRNDKGRTKFNLFIIRISNTGKLLNSKPCKECSKIIRESSNFISKVIYSTDDNDLHIEKPNNIYSHHHSIGNRVRLRVHN